MQVDLARKATLVNLSISQWYNKKADARALRSVADTFQANTADDKYTKTLVPVTALSGISTVVSQLRSYHMKTTLAWDNEGLRILPAVQFFPYVQEVGGYKAKLEHAVEDFLVGYPQLVQEAQARKNGLFNMRDYPDAADLREMFSVTTTFMPFPAGDDFRLEIDEKLMATLKSDAAREYEARVGNAVKQVHQRFRLYLREWEEAIAAGSTRKSHATKIRALCDIAPTQNLIGDEKLTRMIEQCSSLLEISELNDVPARIHTILQEAL